MPSYVNDVYVHRKLAHIDEQIAAIKAKRMATPLGNATREVKSLEFQRERKEILLWATAASDDDVQKALRMFDQARQPVLTGAVAPGDLSGLPFEAIQAQAYWELIMCVTTPPDAVTV